MDITAATPFENLDAYTAATTAQEEGVPVPILSRFIIARGEKATADLLSVNQVLLTCAEAVEAGSADGRPDLDRLVLASRVTGPGGGAPNPHHERNAKRALVQATGDYLWGCTNNGGLLSVGEGVVFPSAMPPTALEPAPFVPPPALQFPTAHGGDKPVFHHVDKRARTVYSEFDRSVSGEKEVSAAATPIQEEPPLTSITATVQVRVVACGVSTTVVGVFSLFGMQETAGARRRYQVFSNR